MHFASTRHLLRAQRGFTLIELGISLIIVGLLFAAVIPSIDAVTGVRARESAAKMTGMVRYMYNQSALSGRPCRMTFDMDARAYWAECTDTRFVLDTELEKSVDGHAEIAKKPVFNAGSSADGFAIDAADSIKQERERIEKGAQFNDFSADEIEKQKLPNGVELSVWVDHQTERYKTGKAFLYFFPQGYTERAQIYLTSGETVYTIKVSALTGKSHVEPRELELPPPREVY